MVLRFCLSMLDPVLRSFFIKYTTDPMPTAPLDESAAPIISSRKLSHKFNGHRLLSSRAAGVVFRWERTQGDEKVGQGHGPYANDRLSM